jgi:hypothetical protein
MTIQAASRTPDRVEIQDDGEREVFHVIVIAPCEANDRFPHRMNVASRRIGTVSAQSHVERRGDEEDTWP